MCFRIVSFLLFQVGLFIIIVVISEVLCRQEPLIMRFFTATYIFHKIISGGRDNNFPKGFGPLLAQPYMYCFHELTSLQFFLISPADPVRGLIFPILTIESAKSLRKSLELEL